MKPRKCLICKEEFSPRSHNQLLCSNECRQKYHDQIYYSKVEKVFDNTSATGVYSELLAAAEFLRNQYYVFKSVSKHAPCDFIAMKNNKFLKIEVRTAIQNKKTKNISFNKNGDYDILVAVVRNGKNHKFHYYPKHPDELCRLKEKRVYAKRRLV